MSRGGVQRRKYPYLGFRLRTAAVCHWGRCMRGPALDVRFHPRDQTTVSLGGDGKVRLWRFDTNVSLVDYALGVECLAICPDGTMLAAAGCRWLPNNPKTG